MSDQANARNLDVVFVVDATGSMGPVIEVMKEAAERLYDDLKQGLEGGGANLSSYRVRLISFRDYGTDEDPMVCTDFYALPEEKDAYKGAVDAIDAHGGGDIPENGLEALFFAAKSDFRPEEDVDRLIVLFTDARALEPFERKDSEGYPEDMVDLDGLVDLLNADSSRRKIVLFAPKETLYEQLAARVEKAYFIPVSPYNGVGELGYDLLYKLFSNIA